MLAALLAARGCDEAYIQRCLEGDLKEEQVHELNGRTPREAMQTLGTEWGRDCMCFDFWINAALDQIGHVILNGGRVVVDDLRFPNEAHALRDIGGWLADIKRPGATHNGHQAEGQLDDFPFDVVIPNTGSLEDLADKVRVAMDYMSETI